MAARRPALLLLMVVCEVLFTTAYRIPPPRFVRLDEGFRANKEYTYDYETTTMISLESYDEADQTSMIKLRTRAHLTLLNNDIAVVRFEEPRLEKSDIDSTDAVRTKWVAVDEKSELALREQLVKPVAFRFEDHATITNVKVDSSEPAWSINMKKAFLQLFQLDLTGRRPAAADMLVKPSEDESEPTYARRTGSSSRPSTQNVYTVVEESVFGTCDTLYVVRDAKEDRAMVSSAISATETTDLPVFEVKKSRNATRCIDMPKFNVSNIAPEPSSPKRDADKMSTGEPTRHTNVVEYVLAGSRRDYVIVSADLTSQIVLSLPIAVKPMSHPKPNAEVVVDSWSRLKLVKVEKMPTDAPKTEGPAESRALRSPLRLESPELDRMMPDVRDASRSQPSSSPVDAISPAGSITESNEEAISREEKWRMDKLKDVAAKFCDRKVKADHDKAAVSILEAVRAVRKIRPEKLNSIIAELPCSELRLPLVEAFVIENKPRTVEAVISLVRDAKLSIKEVKNVLSFMSLSMTPKTSEISALKTLCDEFETKPMRFRRPESSEESRMASSSVTDEMPETEKFNLKKRCYLAYSNLVGNVCGERKLRAEWAELKNARCDGEKFAEELRQLLRSAKSPREEYLALTAVSNAGLPQLFPELSAIIRDRSNLRHPEAIYALRHIASLPDMQKRVRDLLLPVYMDSRLPEDVRIASYVLIMRTRPSLPVVTVIANSISNEKSSQVASYVYSHLSNIAKATSAPLRTPVDPKIASFVKKIVDRPTSPDAISKPFKYSIYSDKLDAGASIDASIVSRRGLGPNTVFGRLNLDLLGKSMSPIEFGAAVRPLHQHDFSDNKHSDKNENKEEQEEMIVRHILETVGVRRFFDSFASRRSASPATDDGKVDFSSYRDILTSPLRESREPITGYRANYYVKVFGKILSFEHTEISELKALVNKMVLGLLRPDNKVEDSKTYANVLAKSELVMPTDSGLFVSFSGALASIVTLKRRAEINIASSPRSISGAVHPIVGVAGEIRANVELPFLRVGLATNAKMRFELPLNAKADLVEDGVKLTINPHYKEYDILKASMKTIVFEEPLMREGSFKPEPVDRKDDKPAQSPEEEERKRDFEPEKVRTVEYRNEKSICSSPSRCVMKRITNAWTMPFLGCKMVAEASFNSQEPMAGPVRFRLTQRKSPNEPLEIKISSKTLEDLTAADIMERLEKLSGVKLSDKEHMKSLLDRKDRYAADDEETREPTPKDSEHERRRDEKRAKLVKKVDDFDINDIRNKYIKDEKVRVQEVEIDAKVANRKSKLVVSMAKSNRHIHVRAYAEADLSEKVKALWETIVPIEKDFGNLARSIESSDLSIVKDLKSFHSLRYGKNLERKVAIQVNAKDVDEDRSVEQETIAAPNPDSYLTIEERHSTGEEYKHAITSKLISTYKSALESLPELIRSFKRCIRNDKYGFDKCRETKAEYVYKCLSKHVEDAERDVDDEKEAEQLRQETIVKVDRCVTENFIEKLYLRQVSVFVTYDRIPEEAAEVLPKLLNIFGVLRHGHFEPANLRPSHFVAKMSWSEDLESMDVAVYTPKVSFKSYSVPSLLPPPNRVFGYGPIDSSVAALLRTKAPAAISVARPFCKLTVPYSVVAGKESMEKQSLKSFDGAKFEVTLPRHTERSLAILASSCNTHPDNAFKPRQSANEPAPIWVGVERTKNESPSSPSRKVVIRVDETVYRVDADCKATVMNVRDEMRAEAESVRRHIIVPSSMTEQDERQSKDLLQLYRYDDAECRIREKSTGIEVKFDGHNVKVSVDPLRTGFDSPICGLCGDLNADFWARETTDRNVRRSRVERAVTRNCLAPVYAANSRADDESDREYDEDATREDVAPRKPSTRFEDNEEECEIVFKTTVEVKTDARRICFSREAMPACSKKCRPSETRSESVSMICLEDNEENREIARRIQLSKESLTYGMGRLYAHPVMVSEVRNVPTRCERSN